MTRRILIAVTALLTCVPGIKAQTAYDKAADLGSWLQGRNAAGIRNTVSPARLSYAEASGGFTSGSFRSMDEGSTQWNAGAVAKTLVDLDDFSLMGSFSFNQEQGYDMSGSMFIHPGFYPVDVLEFTPGRKTLQDYSFTGGIAVPIDGRWTVGGRMDFESGNYSKRKDIRHTNYRLDITVSPSVTFEAGRWKFGVAGILQKTSESIQAEQIGTATADSYFAFLDKGMMYGSYQVWNGSGIHLAEAGIDRFAVKELSSGPALQAQLSSRNGTFHAEAEYLSTSGEVGEKSYTFYKFPGASARASIGYSWHQENGEGKVKVAYSWRKQGNDEYVIDKVSSGGVVNPVTYGHNRIFDRRIMDISPDWTFYGAGRLSWLYNARLRLGWTRSKLQSQPQFPYVAVYSSDILSLSASGTVRCGRMRFGALIECMDGFSTDTDNIGLQPSDESPDDLQLYPVRQDDLWKQRVEWETAPRICGSLSARYDLPVRKVPGLYSEISGSMVHGFGITVLEGSCRFGGTVRIGYEF